jgi:hypothetical protein
MVTASRRIAPSTMYLTSAGCPTRSRSFETLPITSAPSKAAQTRPRPPNRLVPPITAAAIASSSSVPPPVWVLAACSRAVEIKALIALAVGLFKVGRIEGAIR